jgi:glycosyltransferase involved in cell wall biosynthesis
MLSIIIPTYNEEKLIATTLSTLEATLSLPHEIIVSDGGSTDRTVELAKSHASKIVTASAPGRPTVSQGRNAGARIAAAGDFYIFLDADCAIPEPDRFFTRALSCFAADPQLVGLSVCLRGFPAEETLGDKIVLGIANLALRFWNNVLNRGHAFGAFQMIRQDAFKQLGGYRADLVTAEDGDMFRRLAKIGRIGIAPDLTVFHSRRRNTEIGWTRQFLTAAVNFTSVRIRDRAVSKQWRAIR